MRIEQTSLYRILPDLKRQRIEKYIEKIAEMLLLTGNLNPFCGLLHGKMGTVIFLFHYARYKGSKLLEDISSDIIKTVCTQAKREKIPNYCTGAAGIVTGLYYLAQHAFISPDDDFCAEMDSIIQDSVATATCRNDFSLYSGLTGYGRYCMTRNRKANTEMLLHAVGCIEKNLPLIDETEQPDVYFFLRDLQDSPLYEKYVSNLLTQCKQWSVVHDESYIFSRLGRSGIGNNVCLYYRNVYHETFADDFDNVDSFMTEPVTADINTGLLNGCAGKGLCLLTVLDRKIADWMYLL